MAEEKNVTVKAEKPAKVKKQKAKKEKTRKASRFFADLKSEMKKITWYSKKDTLKSSGLVIAVLVVFAIIIGAIDWSFGQLIALLGTLY